MAIALVQTQSKDSASGSVSSLAATWGSNTTTGNLIIVVTYTSFAAFSTVSSISDSQTNTYTKIDSGTSGVGNSDFEFWYAKNITGGTTPTVTVHYSGSQQSGFLMREYSGLDTTAPLDQHTFATATGNGGAQSSGNTAATGNANDLIVGWGASSANSTFSAAGTGFGNYTAFVANGNYSLAFEDKTVSATGVQAATFPTANATNSAIGVAAFKGAAGGGATFIAAPNRLPGQAVNRAGTY